MNVGSSTKKILVVEPNAYLSEALAGILTAFGYEVVGTTAQCDEIINLVRELEPDLLLIDFDLSQQTDIAAVKAQIPELKVVASLWHEAIDELAEIAKMDGLDGFVCKYGSRDDLLNSLSTL